MIFLSVPSSYAVFYPSSNCSFPLQPHKCFPSSNLIMSSCSFPYATLKTWLAWWLCLWWDQFLFIAHRARDPSLKNACQIDKNNLEKWTSITKESEWGWTLSWLYPGNMDSYWRLSQFLKQNENACKMVSYKICIM